MSVGTIRKAPGLRRLARAVTELVKALLGDLAFVLAEQAREFRLDDKSLDGEVETVFLSRTGS